MRKTRGLPRPLYKGKYSSHISPLNSFNSTIKFVPSYTPSPQGSQFLTPKHFELSLSPKRMQRKWGFIFSFLGCFADKTIYSKLQGVTHFNQSNTGRDKQPVVIRPPLFNRFSALIIFVTLTSITLLCLHKERNTSELSRK